MLRIQRSLFAIMILLLAMLQVGCWLRSYWYYDTISVRRFRSYNLTSSLGQLNFSIVSRFQPGLQWYTLDDLSLRHPGQIEWSDRWNLRYKTSHLAQGISPAQTKVAGFGWRSDDPFLPLFTIPHWFISAVLLSALCVVVRPMMQQMRRRKGSCRRCGYDLRASKYRCPECGEPIAPNAGGGKRVILGGKAGYLDFSAVRSDC